MTLRARLGAALSAGAALAAAGCGASSGLVTGPPRSPEGSVIIWACGRTATVRPRTLTLACADDGIAFADLRWRHWGAETATARGRGEATPCVPSCVASRPVAYPVRLTVSAPVIGDHHAAYSQITVRAIAGHPAHTPGRLRESLYTSGRGGRS